MRPWRHSDHRRDTAGQRVRSLLWREEVGMCFNTTGCGDEEVAMHHSCVGAATQGGINAIHDVGIAGLANTDNQAVSDANVAFHDA